MNNHITLQSFELGINSEGTEAETSGSVKVWFDKVLDSLSPCAKNY